MDCEEIKEDHPEIKFEPCCPHCHKADEDGEDNLLWVEINGILSNVCCRVARAFYRIH